MTAKEIENRIKVIIARQLSCDIDSIAADAHLQKDLYADSLDILTIRVNIENVFAIVFSEKELQNLLQLDEIVRIVCGKVG